MINKICHIIWIGDKIPKFQQKIIDKNIKILNKQDINVIVWNNKTIATEFQKMPSWVIKALLDKKYSLATDYFRLHLIYRYGGIYIDADHELIKKIPQFVLESDFFTGRIPSGYINNGFFGASKGNEILLKIMKKIQLKVNIYNYIKPPRVESLFIFGDIIEKTDALILNSDYLYPFFPGEKTTGITENTFANHYFAYSWSDKWYLKLCNKFGFIKLSLFIRKFTNDHKHF